MSDRNVPERTPFCAARKYLSPCGDEHTCTNKRCSEDRQDGLSLGSLQLPEERTGVFEEVIIPWSSSAGPGGAGTEGGGSGVVHVEAYQHVSGLTVQDLHV